MKEACVRPIYFSKTTGFLIYVAKREPLLGESRNHATFSTVLQTVKTKYMKSKSMLKINIQAKDIYIYNSRNIYIYHAYMIITNRLREP